MKKRSITIAGHRTSISLEAPFWDAFQAIAAAQNKPLATLVREIDAGRGAANLSSAIRIYVLQQALSAKTPEHAQKPAF